MRRVLFFIGCVSVASCNRNLSRDAAFTLINKSSFITDAITQTVQLGHTCESPDKGFMRIDSFLEAVHPELAQLQRTGFIYVNVQDVSDYVRTSLSTGSSDAVGEWQEMVDLCLAQAIKPLVEQRGMNSLGLAMRRYVYIRISQGDKTGLAGLTPKRDTKDRLVITIPVATKKLLEVTGVSTNPDGTSYAECKYQYIATTVGTDTGLAAQLPSGPQTSRFQFRRYDDGWRLE